MGRFNSPEPSLIFEVRVNGKPADPRLYLRVEENRGKLLEEKQKATDRAAQVKVETASKAQAAEQKILDQYKEKCSNLGFKVGTDAFGKCVLQLTK
jgi:septal ring factor EnvC (AmiA/AmiB activator)